MSVKSYKFEHIDDFVRGPYPIIAPWDGIYEWDQHICRKTNIKVTKKYCVYHAVIDPDKNEDVRLKCIAEFDKLSDANRFAKIQYYLYIGRYPEISCCGRHERQPFHIDENITCQIGHKKSRFWIEYLVISDGEYVNANCLDPMAGWW